MVPRVLIVEDHPTLRQHLAVLLQAMGAEVVGEASDGAQALQLTVALEPDVVLLDLSLPDRSGLEVMRQMREQVARSKVIILTAYEGNELRRVCLDAGAVAFVSKAQLRAELEGARREATADVAGSMCRLLRASRARPGETGGRAQLGATKSATHG